MDFQSPHTNGGFDAANNFIDPSAMFDAPNQMNGTRPYPTSSIPSKRDSTGASLSRSQTPSQQGQFGFQQGFAHTPSPTLHTQNFATGAVPPQRMQTVSPAQNQNMQQMSAMGFMQGSPMPQGYNQNFGGQVQMPQLTQNLQSRQQEAQRQYQMRLQAQQHQLGNLAASNMAAQQRHQMFANPAAQQAAMQRNMGMAQQPQNAQPQVQSFLKNVGALMASMQRPFNPQPRVAGRVINLQQLYYAVMKLRGSKHVTQTGSWPRVAQMMQIDPRQFPQVSDELRITYEHNLGPYEAAYLMNKQQQQMRGMAAQQGQMGGMGPMAAMGGIPQPGQQMSPTRQIPQEAQNNAVAQQQYMQQLQRSQTMQQRQTDITTPVKTHAATPSMNGSGTPQLDGKMSSNAFDQHRKSLSQQLEATPPQGQGPGYASPSPGPSKVTRLIPQEVSAPVIREKVVHEAEDPTLFRPITRTIHEAWGGLSVFTPEFDHLIAQTEMYKPNMPSLGEMGVIDIRALTMSIRSGLHAEARLALDIFVKLTYEQQIVLELDKCDDLIDVLVEYAEDLLDLLANDNPEVSDILDLSPYEEVVRSCRVEMDSVPEVHEFGTKEYELERTADRLIAITTILRNLSFLEVNHNQLCNPAVLKFMSYAIRLVGTRILLLRTHINTADFMKDLITFFSNTGTKIILPSRDEAYTILQFLCAFAPCPRPELPVRFAPYSPTLHRCLPAAVDSLAKLLARDDPNRTFYKHVFAAESTSTPPYDLLTRAFALAVSVVPETMSRKGGVREARIAEARKAFLIQGMLAADILASLAPGAESGVCRSWLEAEDGWGENMLAFTMFLTTIDHTAPPPQVQYPGLRPGAPQRQRMEPDIQGFHLIVHRALSMLKRLGDKSRGVDVLVKGEHLTNGNTEHDEDSDEDMETVVNAGTKWKVKTDVLPTRGHVIGALLQPDMDPHALRLFCGIADLDRD
ncbi:uncharacterized protein BDR25DRAFT_287397 [Lindgomyces ingoldianus]|uniref:Uncharacterized protein n=1 Tax=Lindgomyces ingoldianus TaxID=673940 RepID=A0ACB6QU38_9PLEO|nr:uncharacterized protein BDR25DRAFT_287397 [Lindgomyces ingoldianus]KAF2470446.1 hypothetical protein BDR25DRAFT_287397 [Lindgomyces ingoldianus]